MDVSIQEVDYFVRVLAFEFYGDVGLVDVIEEFQEGFFTACPYKKDIVFETCVAQMSASDSKGNVLLLEFAHKNVCI